MIIISSVVFLLFGFSSASSVAVITSDGEIIRKIDLALVEEPYTLEVISADGGKNTLLIEKGRICVKSADCPDKTCVNSGWLNGSLPVICIPHRLEISFENSSLDGVSR